MVCWTLILLKKALHILDIDLHDPLFFLNKSSWPYYHWMLEDWHFTWISTQDYESHWSGRQPIFIWLFLHIFFRWLIIHYIDKTIYIVVVSQEEGCWHEPAIGRIVFSLLQSKCYCFEILISTGNNSLWASSLHTENGRLHWHQRGRQNLNQLAALTFFILLAFSHLIQGSPSPILKTIAIHH